MATGGADARLEPTDTVLTPGRQGFTPYPLQILVWHEIVNDNLGGRAVGVADCTTAPLSNSGLVFDRVDRRTLGIGTSGKLWGEMTR